MQERSKKGFHPESQKKHGLANTLIAGFWPLGLQENKSVIPSNPGGGTLLRQAQGSDTPCFFLQKHPEKCIHICLPSRLQVQVHFTAKR